MQHEEIPQTPNLTEIPHPDSKSTRLIAMKSNCAPSLSVHSSLSLIK
ncbi:unnamed protein product [Allacma fusca]|uniref:Uncharacterized protein n=1 Tax=Allacma fusca TaxID=39272 RepID=A0A8J2K1U9_9HEXA|nr:unnamed protein product [Allacma fusca]